jgi:hypothetical protein
MEEVDAPKVRKEEYDLEDLDIFLNNIKRWWC